MPSVTLSSLVGGGISEISFYSGLLQIPAGSTGNILVLTPPAGKRVILNNLVGPSNNITIVGSKVGTVVSNLILSIGPNAGTFQVAGYFSATAENNAGGSSAMFFAIDEVVTVTAGVATTAIVYYSYTYGS